MGFLKFLSGGGSGLITGIAGTIAGAVSSAKDRDNGIFKIFKWWRKRFNYRNRRNHRRSSKQR
nr:MAG TPA: hypothetical protein [Microviridae sp.]